MKRKVLQLCLCLNIILLMTSCYTNIQCISPYDYEKNNKNIGVELANMGYVSVGNSTKTENTLSVSDVSYSRYTGYGTALQNNYAEYETFLFADSLNNRVEYELKKVLQKNRAGITAFSAVTTMGCKTSNPKDYHKACDEIVGENVNKIERNAEVQVLNVGATVTTIVVVSVVLGFATILPVLLLL